MISHPLLERVRVRSHAITDGNSMFCGLSGLRQVEIDTAGIEIFEKFFHYCVILTSIPQIDTSSGVNFNSMFQGCSALLAIPPLDTSNGKDFSGMFAWLTDYGGRLASIPLLDTSQAETAGAMFTGCSLRTIPALDLRRMVGYIDFDYSRSLCSIDVRRLGEGIDPDNDDRIWVGLQGTNLSAAALNAFYAYLAPVDNRGIIYLYATPGVVEPDHQPELATSKGWTIAF